MADGHLNKCKTCTKNDVKAREIHLKKDPVWIDAERERGRDKYHRLGYKDTQRVLQRGRRKKAEPRMKKIQMLRYKERYPEKLSAKNLSQRLKPIHSGNQMHHWSYCLCDAKDVIELSISDHALLHRFLTYDQTVFKYRRKDTGELLDTKEKHLDYFHLVYEAEYGKRITA